VILAKGLVAVAAVGLACWHGAPAGAATLKIDITNVRNTTGRVHVDLCRTAEFLKKCAVVADVMAAKGTTMVTIENVAPGTYAVQATYDENGNGKVDRGLFGIPREGVGFSNDAPIRLGPPKWADAMFVVDGDRQITLKMRYF
jgi:uncharacterized protein (DUF2141 family)